MTRLQQGHGKEIKKAVYSQGYVYPSTRQRLHKMGKFFKEIRQKSVRETSRKRQAKLQVGGQHMLKRTPIDLIGNGSGTAS